MIIIISGASSSGKSSVSYALKQMLGDSWVLFSTDGYLSMLGDKFQRLHPDNASVCVPNDICYAKKHEDGTYEIITGKLCAKLYSTIPDILDIIAKQKLNIIVDSLITDKEDFLNYKKKLSKYGLLTVFLDLPIDVLEQRESLRGDRLKGSAIHWLNKMDFKEESDLILDGNSGVESIVDIINKNLIQKIR
jgi:chloramphenicol 3-O-phosphotransferase